MGDRRVFTGGENEYSQLGSQLLYDMEHSSQVDIIVSFLMESGTRLLINSLDKAIENGAKVSIITGLYLNLTSPSALCMLLSAFGDRIDLRVYKDTSISFHPKCYFIQKDGCSCAYIGSSNISKSALCGGVEWNYKLTSDIDDDSLSRFYDEYLRIKENETVLVDEEFIERYRANWRKPEVLSQIDDGQDVGVVPRGAQIEALFALDKTRSNGYDKALILAATGIGKTYLAAFDSLNYKHVLFVAHRKEILNQAYDSFKVVRNGDSGFGFFDSTRKDRNANVLFASVATLGNKDYLNSNYYDEGFFDYIVIDEFHHAVNKAYINIIEYFKPKFLLGLTATPDRYDRRDIYVLCNYNVPYSINLRQAIDRGLLVPFRYYGIYDLVDYSGMSMINGRYSESELTAAYKASLERKELILKQYLKHKKRRALAFCCSISHSLDMAGFFCERGVRAVSVSSSVYGEYSLDREDAIWKIQKGEIDIIFSVDMFNEGLDIPQIDLVLFLRPTESPVVFLQQLGRGLRISEGKDYLTVLDFIGNYKNAGRLPELIDRELGEPSDHDFLSESIVDYTYPKGCIVDFDLKLLDLFEQIKRNSLNREDRILEDLKLEYMRIKPFCNGIVTAMDLFSGISLDVFISSYKSNITSLNGKKSIPNVLQDFLDFKRRIGDLSDAEKYLVDTIAEDFLKQIGSMNMEKSYKIPILLAFYNNGNIKMAITQDDVYCSYFDFYHKDGNWRDLESRPSTADLGSGIRIGI